MIKNALKKARKAFRAACVVGPQALGRLKGSMCGM